MLWGLFTRRPTLSGAPATPRRKTYSAQSGYVYRYCYYGWRKRAPLVEFVFRFSAGTAGEKDVSVLLSEPALARWESAHARTLSSTERYALAKMALFQAFDERPSPASMKQDVRVRAADLEALANSLGFDE
jgi:hypothetical protein